MLYYILKTFVKEIPKISVGTIECDNLLEYLFNTDNGKNILILVYKLEQPFSEKFFDYMLDDKDYFRYFYSVDDSIKNVYKKYTSMENGLEYFLNKIQIFDYTIGNRSNKFFVSIVPENKYGMILDFHFSNNDLIVPFSEENFKQIKPDKIYMMPILECDKTPYYHVSRLEDEIKKLKAHILSMPDGELFLKAQKHYDSLSKKKDTGKVKEKDTA